MNKIFKKIIAYSLIILFLVNMSNTGYSFSLSNFYYYENDLFFFSERVFAPMTLSDLEEVENIVLDDYFLNGDYIVIHFTPEQILEYQNFLYNNNISTMGNIIGITKVIPNSYVNEYNYYDILPNTNIMFGNHIYNVRRLGYVSRRIQSLGTAATSSPNVTLGIAHQSFASHTFSSSISVSAHEVSAGVGFNVNFGSSIQVNASWTTPPNSRGGMIQVFPLYNFYSFNIISFSFFQISGHGTGSALRASGFYFVTTTF